MGGYKEEVSICDICGARKTVRTDLEDEWLSGNSDVVHFEICGITHCEECKQASRRVKYIIQAEINAVKEEYIRLVRSKGN